MRSLRSLIVAITDRRRRTPNLVRIAQDEDLTLRILRAPLRSEPAMVRFTAIGKIRTDVEAP